MPYIKPEKRNALYPTSRQPARTPGELNYQITMLCLSYLAKFGANPSYGDRNEVMGALQCAGLEFYRRAVAPYEDAMIGANGDVY